MDNVSSSSGFWVPGAAAPGLPAARDGELEDNFVYNPNSSKAIQLQRSLLPITNNMIVVGATGTGKSTQIPQFLDEFGWTKGGRQVCCTQPRRVAATSVAERVAHEMGSKLGSEVGYSIRFEEISSKSTRIKYLTDGMLIREMMIDPLLSNYSVVMIDEAHERSINTDILLGLLKKIQSKRQDLRLIISSATVDAMEFQNYFNRNSDSSQNRKNWINPEMKSCASILSVEGRLFPVEVYYTHQPVSDYLKASLDAIFEIHQTYPMGMNQKEKEANDILVFLTGQEEIDKLVRMVTERILREEQQSPDRFDPMVALPMYSGLPSDLQARVFQPSLGKRKVIISTNICETSVTIEGIGYVIDAGFVKIRTYDPSTGQSSLVVVPISKSSANQRAGRAGRTCPGKCLRLYTETSFERLPVKMVPELQRTNLAPMILQLKALGIDNLLKFDFLSPPPSSLIANAMEILFSLGILDYNAKLTDPLGLAIAEIPLEPTLSKVLIMAQKNNCIDSLLSIAAMLSVPSVFVQPRGLEKKAETLRRKFSVKEGDHLTLLNIFNAFVESQYDAKWCHSHYFNYKSLGRAVEIRSQLKKTFRRLSSIIQSLPRETQESKSTESDHVIIRKCLLYGFFTNVARLQPDGTYKTIRGNGKLYIHPSSILSSYPPDWVLFHEVVHTTEDYMREVSQIEASWLTEVAPHYYQKKELGYPETAWP